MLCLFRSCGNGPRLGGFPLLSLLVWMWVVLSCMNSHPYVQALQLTHTHTHTHTNDRPLAAILTPAFQQVQHKTAVTESDETSPSSSSSTSTSSSSLSLNDDVIDVSYQLPVDGAGRLSTYAIFYKWTSFTLGVNWGRSGTVDEEMSRRGIKLDRTPRAQPTQPDEQMLCFFNITAGTPIGKDKRPPQTAFPPKQNMLTKESVIKYVDQVYLVQRSNGDLYVYDIHHTIAITCGSAIVTPDLTTPHTQLQYIHPQIEIRDYLTHRVQGLPPAAVYYPIHVPDRIDESVLDQVKASYQPSEWNQRNFALTHVTTHLQKQYRLLHAIFTVLSSLDGPTVLRIKQLGDLVRELLKVDQLKEDDAVALKDYFKYKGDMSKIPDYMRLKQTRHRASQQAADGALQPSDSESPSKGESKQSQSGSGSEPSAAHVRWARHLVHTYLPSVSHYSHVTYWDDRFPWNLEHPTPASHGSFIIQGKPIVGKTKHKDAWKTVHHRKTPQLDSQRIQHLINEAQMKTLLFIPANQLERMTVDKSAEAKALKKAYKAVYHLAWDEKKLEKELIKTLAEFKRKLEAKDANSIFLPNRISVFITLYYAAMIEPSVNFYHHPIHTTRHNRLHLLIALLTIFRFAEPLLPEPESILTLEFFKVLAEDMPKRRDTYNIESTPVFDRLVEGDAYGQFVSKTLDSYARLKKGLLIEWMHSTAQGVYARFFDLPEWTEFTSQGVDYLIQLGHPVSANLTAHSEWFMLTEDDQYSACPNRTYHNRTHFMFLRAPTSLWNKGYTHFFQLPQETKCWDLSCDNHQACDLSRYYHFSKRIQRSDSQINSAAEFRFPNEVLKQKKYFLSTPKATQVSGVFSTMQDLNLTRITYSEANNTYSLQALVQRANSSCDCRNHSQIDFSQDDEDIPLFNITSNFNSHLSIIKLLGAATIESEPGSTPTDVLYLQSLKAEVPKSGLASAVWFSDPQETPSFARLNIFHGFEANFTFKLHSNCEGFAFVLQSWKPTALGTSGQGLGYAGINQSLAVEFDFFRQEQMGDPTQPHISIHSQYHLANNESEKFSLGSAIIPNTINLMDGKQHLAHIIYHTAENRHCEQCSTNGLLSVYLDDGKSAVLTLPLDDLKFQLVFKEPDQQYIDRPYGANSARVFVGLTAGSSTDATGTVSIHSFNFTSFAEPYKFSTCDWERMDFCAFETTPANRHGLNPIPEDERVGSCQRMCCNKPQMWGRSRTGICYDCNRSRYMTGWQTPMTYLSDLNRKERHHHLTRRYVELIDLWFDKKWKKRPIK